ncbi:fumarate respiration transcriptional regulator dcuR [Vibrio ishigakensis]|uniref:Transcriptional regulatory protein n=1 Tax=Vibrio ishigakensis TaxID=1481914 RepID=A0A0B8NZT3_9VIBR|nr:response regulator [Vibrio ishigakensis]GAM57832.1 fumarate respiration transcriptional regulator dcuR [Vibrio ishigakensis]
MNNKIRTLIIEDDEAIAQLHLQYLQANPNLEIVGIALNKKQAEMQIDLLNPDLIILDVYLPDGTGLELIQGLRQQGKQTDIILITAAREPEILQSAMRLGVVEYLLKPVMLPRLDTAINNYLSKQQLIESTDTFDQDFVDSLLSAERKEQESEPDRLPKGIDAVTLNKIRDLFKGQNAWKADEAGKEIGASRSTARRYLEFLVSTQEVKTDVLYGTVGRPERTYVRQ